MCQPASAASWASSAGRAGTGAGAGPLDVVEPIVQDVVIDIGEPGEHRSASLVAGVERVWLLTDIAEDEKLLGTHDVTIVLALGPPPTAARSPHAPPRSSDAVVRRSGGNVTVAVMSDTPARSARAATIIGRGRRAVGWERLRLRS